MFLNNICTRKVLFSLDAGIRNLPDSFFCDELPEENQVNSSRFGIGEMFGNWRDVCSEVEEYFPP